MIRSMTAFASAESETAHGNLSIELRSVNHRYLELSPRLPDDLRSFETPLRETLTARLSRGKVDVTMRLKAAATRSVALDVNDELLTRLAAKAQDLANRFPSLNVDFTSVLNWPGVLCEQSADAEGLHAAAANLLDQALVEFIATREREGERLAVFLRERLDGIEAIVAAVREHLPEVRTAARARLDQRLAEIKQPADPGRIEQEIVLQLQRMMSMRNSIALPRTSPKRVASLAPAMRSGVVSISSCRSSIARRIRWARKPPIRARPKPPSNSRS